MATPAEFSVLHRELVMLIRIMHEMDREYEESRDLVNPYTKKLEKLTKEFEKKYAVGFKLKQTMQEFRLHLMLPEKNIVTVFDEVCRGIQGLRSIGTQQFDEALVEDAPAVKSILASDLTSLYLTYVTPDLGMHTVVLLKDNEDSDVELAYDEEQVVVSRGPEFMILAQYALKGKRGSDADLVAEAKTFGFDSLLTHREKRQYLDRFDPHFEI